MISDQAAQSIWYVLVLVMVGSALLSRRLPIRQSIAMLLIWAAVFGCIAVIYAKRHDFLRMLKIENASEVQSTAPTSSNAKSIATRLVRIPIASDNHFWVDGEINGHSIRFLIDSGATITALSHSAVQEAGLGFDQNQPGVILQTANGRIIAQRTNISGLKLGDIQMNDLGAVASSGFGETNVLGMNFLSRLKSWRVENGEMILEQ